MGAAELHAHLAGGLTTVARAWAVTRRDGTRLGFTDHDGDLVFDTLTFKADSGLTARALSQATGLSVDNSEAMGALSAAAISETDIAAGRYDGAEVVCWLVNWADVEARKILFRGTIGEIRRGDGAFHAELRGLTETLNRPVGRVYQKPCTAVLGDKDCGFDLTSGGYVFEGGLVGVEDDRVLLAGALPGFSAGWFQRGRVEVLSGAAQGLSAAIKRDQLRADGTRVIEVWEKLRVAPVAGDQVRFTAGCDKRFETCRLKFGNHLNFRGFPDLPEEDWITVHPSQAKRLDGGSRR
ncbi:DUF2163 domain-containing protein [Maliponia aquimaris]|uniref:Bacteriophage phiJL001 Gp84 C-terminal domain-containing protein n=1 Tax=Maliponia aquimaris TaxID=1673631 RepID=A0A238K1E8_9RHOB|nr:DUF2163 domain-containing protein [Maliponia aquimaris]SMX36705.1 hypothetical protein MAA8898_00998 [Maliponia aquimaris]